MYQQRHRENIFDRPWRNDFLGSKDITKDIGTAITNLVLEYRQGDGNTEKEKNINNEEILQAMNRQWAIGFYPWICGFMCSDWARLQDTHFEQIGSRRCPKQWTAAQLAEKLIDIIFDQWNHSNEILHKHENTITEKKHNELNTNIQTILAAFQIWDF